MQVVLTVLIVLLLCGCVSRNQAVETGTNEPVTVSFAVEAFKQGRYAESITSYSTLLGEDDKDHKAFNGRGVAFLALDRNQQALSDFKRALSLAPQISDYHVNVSIVFLRLQQPEKALAEADEAVRLNPLFADALLARGVALMHMEEYEEALGSINRALIVEEKRQEQGLGKDEALYHSLLYYRAMAQQRVGLHEDSIRDYTTYIAAVKSGEKKAFAYANRGLCYLETGDMDKALDDLDIAVQLNLQDAMTYYDRGIVRQRRNELKKAIQDYTRAISHMPDFPEAYINRGSVRLILERTDQACHDFERACSKGFCGRLDSLREQGLCE